MSQIWVTFTRWPSGPLSQVLRVLGEFLCLDLFHFEDSAVV